MLQVRYLCRQDVLLCGVTHASLELNPEILQIELRAVEGLVLDQVGEAGVSNGIHELNSEVNNPKCTVVLGH